MTTFRPDAGRPPTRWLRACSRRRTRRAENIAGHLLHVEPAGDGRVVEILREAAAISLGRGAPEQAVSYLRRALAESPSQEHRLHVLRGLGAAEIAAGEQGAAEHLLEALALAPQTERAGIAEEASIALSIAAARHEEAIALLHREIAVVAAMDEDAALRLDAGMLGAAVISGAAYPNQHELIPRLLRMRGETPGERNLLANGSGHLLFYEGGCRRCAAVRAAGLRGRTSARRSRG